MEKQIEKQAIDEMANDLIECHTEFADGNGDIYTNYDETAEKMVAKGYRKQSEGEWIRKLRYSRNYDDFFSYTCSECNTHRDAPTNYCPNCGAHMSGGKTNE